MADEQAQSLDQKLDGLDDNLQPIKQDNKQDEKSADADEKKADKAEEKQEDQDKSADEAGASEDKSAEDSEAAGTGESESEEASASDDGYTIDDGDEEEEVLDTEDDKTGEQSTSNLTPEQKYILDNVAPIKVRGSIGDGKVQEFEVLAPEQLPNGFKFADDVEMAKATKGFNMLEQRASQLQQDYRTQETDKAAKEFKEREDTADRQDIARLQKEGDLPKFKAKPDTKDFDNDPGVKLVQEVLDFKDKQNNKYMEEYNAGRPYKHIGFDEAYALYKRNTPKTDPAQAKEDKEREDIAKRTARPSGNGSTDAAQKARVHTGMSSRDLDNLIENLDW